MSWMEAGRAAKRLSASSKRHLLCEGSDAGGAKWLVWGCILKSDLIGFWGGLDALGMLSFFWSGEEVGEMRVQGYILNFWLECLKRWDEEDFEQVIHGQVHEGEWLWGCPQLLKGYICWWS